MSFEPGTNSFPDWEDDETIWYNQAGAGRIVSRARDGTGEPRTRIEGLSGRVPLDLSDDGAWVTWTPTVTGRANDLFARPVSDTASARSFLATEVDEMAPSVSPDGRWITYVSEAAGTDDVYVEPFPDGGRRYKVSAGGARSPGWSRDGTRLYYRKYTADRSDSMAVVDVRVTDAGFSTGPERTLFSMETYPTVSDYREWDILPDGTFVMIGLDEALADGSTRMVVVTDALGRVLRDGN